MTYPESISDLEKELLEHAKDGRSDAGFRLAIAVAQLGTLSMHFCHDPIENPSARPYGSRQGEISDAGHAMVQLMTYCALRKIPLQQAINAALDNLRDKDFIAKTGKSEKETTNGTISGTIAQRGRATGTTFVDPFCENLKKMPKKAILVAHHPSTDSIQFMHSCAGIITDHGGISSHAAIVAREFKIPCLVGTGNITSRTKTGQTICIDAMGIEGGLGRAFVLRMGEDR